MPHDHLRHLPAVSALLEHPSVAPHLLGRRREWVTRLAQRVVSELRDALLRGDPAPAPDKPGMLALAVQRLLERRERVLRPTLTRVINGTGVVVHTNLGRSNWPDLAVRWAEQAARHPSDLEYVLASGTRGHRGRKVEEKAALLTGAEDALIVNNNAAAVWLAARHCTGLGAPPDGRGRLILSRGEIVAIGGSFRMHELLAETHCELVEVGTTNRTSLQDYVEAMTPGATVMKVHRSNFSLEGFTEEVALGELARPCREHGCRLVYDAGSGALFPFEALGLPAEEGSLAADVAAGADLVTCSGDKLLGGCQAGLVLGRASLVNGLRQHPMRRAFRVDKTTLAALDAVLTIYLSAEALPGIPTLELLAQAGPLLAARADRLAGLLRDHAPAGWNCRVRESSASVGGGSFSTVQVPSRELLWAGPEHELERIHAALRRQDPAVVGRKNQEGLAVDLRTIADDEITMVAEAFRQAWNGLLERRRGDEGSTTEDGRDESAT
ncbi:MAG: L-seryl-tRNA(Sec) selenium transferase [Candidatus Krumholzibacteriia bacterium]